MDSVDDELILTHPLPDLYLCGACIDRGLGHLVDVDPRCRILDRSRCQCPCRRHDLMIDQRRVFYAEILRKRALSAEHSLHLTQQRLRGLLKDYGSTRKLYTRACGRLFEVDDLVRRLNESRALLSDAMRGREELASSLAQARKDLVVEQGVSAERWRRLTDQQLVINQLTEQIREYESRITKSPNDGRKRHIIIEE